MEALLEALQLVASPQVMVVVLLSATFGIFVGAIPGLTATMAVALLIPVTFHLSDIAAMAAIITLEACAIFAGDIPSTLLRIPGTPASAAYTDDAYALTKAGRAAEALGTNLMASVVGGLLGAFVLIIAAPLFAKIAFAFTTYEYCWLYVIGLSSAVLVSSGTLSKALFALLLGLLLSSVGLSEVHSVPRFTFGQDELIRGVDFIPAMIGLFGVSEVLRNALGSGRGATASASALAPVAVVIRSLRDLVILPLVRLWSRKLRFLLASSIGCVIGILPGAGADIAAWISFGASKRLSTKPEEFGRGSLEGITDATSANNAALAGAWIPALVFGIPGDSVTAIVIGVLLMKNLQPGPRIFETQAPLVYGIYLIFILANLMLVPLGVLAIRLSGRLIRIPRNLLLPAILLFSIVGAYAINSSYFDVGIMLGMGVLGFGLDRYGVPLGPVVLGIVLGGRLEQTFIQSLTKSDSLLAFFERPMSKVLGFLSLALWAAPLGLRLLAKETKRTESSTEP